jgi:hypothetical protein
MPRSVFSLPPHWALCELDSPSASTIGLSGDWRDELMHDDGFNMFAEGPSDRFNGSLRRSARANPNKSFLVAHTGGQGRDCWCGSTLVVQVLGSILSIGGRIRRGKAIRLAVRLATIRQRTETRIVPSFSKASFHAGSPAVGLATGSLRR